MTRSSEFDKNIRWFVYRWDTHPVADTTTPTQRSSRGRQLPGARSWLPDTDRGQRHRRHDQSRPADRLAARCTCDDAGQLTDQPGRRSTDGGQPASSRNTRAPSRTQPGGSRHRGDTRGRPSPSAPVSARPQHAPRHRSPVPGDCDEATPPPSPARRCIDTAAPAAVTPPSVDVEPARRRVFQPTLPHRDDRLPW